VRRVAFGGCLALALVGLAASASAAARPSLTLAQAQREAIENHPQIKAAVFDTAAVREAVNIARAAYAPQAYGSAVSAFAPPETRVSAYLNGITDPTVLQRTGTGVVVSQYVTDFGRTADLVRSYELATRAQAERGQLTRLSVLLDVTQSYFEVLRARALLRVAVETVRERQILLRQVTILQRAGLRSTLDVSIAQRDAAAAKQLIVEAQARRNDGMAALSEAMGSTVEIDYHLADMRTLPAIPKSIGPLIDEMLAINPELAAARSQAASAQSNAEAVRKESSPVVTAYGYFGGTPIRAANQEINEAYSAAGVALTIPITNGGALKAAARQAEDQALSLGQVSQDVENQLLRDTRTAYQDVEAARSNIDVTDEMVRTARQSYDLTAARYRIGLNSIVDLSEAQLAVTQAEIAQTNAIYDYIEQGAALEFVTGVLAPGV
jgi:outer membrane protein